MYILVRDCLERVERIKNATASIGDIAIINMQHEVLVREMTLIRDIKTLDYTPWSFEMWFYCSCGEEFDCQYNLDKHKEICHPYGYGIRDTRCMIEVPHLVFNFPVTKRAKE